MDHPRKYAGLARELQEHREGREAGGAVEKLIAEVQEAAAFIFAHLDRNPDLRLGARFLLLGAAKALASKRMVSGCLGREATPEEEEGCEEAAVGIARAASRIRLD